MITRNLPGRYHVVSFWSQQSTKNYAAPKVRRDILKISQELGVDIVDIGENQLSGLESR